MFPPIPSWEAAHPLIVHFPIALLLVAPILIVAGLFLPGQTRGLFIGALVLMALGTIGIYFAIATGEAAGELAERTPGVASVLERHEELAEAARAIFTAFTIVFAVIAFGPPVFKRTLSRKAVTLVFLVLYAGGTVLLTNVAHQGGLLVHQYGVRAMMSSANQGSAVKDSESRPETETEKEK